MDCENEFSDTEYPTSEFNTKEHKILLNFIKTYEALPELWNPTHPSYSNKRKRNIALDKLLHIYIYIKPEATRADVRRKINTLRTNYRKDFKKVVESNRTESSTDEAYQPKAWVYYALQFLNVLEQPTKSYVQKVNKGDEIHGEHFLTSATSPSSHSSIPSPPTKRKHVFELITKQNELLQKACSFLNKSSKEPQEDLPTIAKVWGEKLIVLDPQQRALAEKAVNDILFEASQGTLQRNSVRINEDFNASGNGGKPIIATNFI